MTAGLSRILGPIVCVIGLAACGASNDNRPGVTSLQPSSGQPACLVAGAECRWDNQCCGGRCYVDTGCDGPVHNDVDRKR